MLKFQLYANFLSQAVYTIFYRAFPDSRLQFGNSFKENLCDTIFEWIVGTGRNHCIENSSLNLTEFIF